MKKLRKLLSWVLLCTLFVQATAMAAPLSETEDNKAANESCLAYYPLEKDVKDYSGNSQDGELKGSNANFDKGSLYLPGGASNSSAGYVELPADVFKNQDTLTISVWLKNETGSNNYAALFFGQGKNSKNFPTHYWLLNPAVIKTGRMKSVMTGATDEGAPYNTECGISPTNADNGVPGPVTNTDWGMYTTVLNWDGEKTVLTGYYNGELVGSVNVANANKVSNFGDEIYAYIGRSSYSDIFYKGYVKELSVYGSVLTEDQVKELYDTEVVSIAENTLTIENSEPIKDDIMLPVTWEGANIAWESSDDTILNAAGEITRSDDVIGEAKVTLTATITSGKASATKTFEVIVAESETVEVPYLAYYPLEKDAKDASDNGNDAEVKGSGSTYADGGLSLPGGANGSDAAYVELPKGMFDGKDTVSISVWLKNQTGSGDYSAMFFGTEKNAKNYPTSYWLLNPSNGSGLMKSVMTGAKAAETPWSTEYGISPTNSAQGIAGPKTSADWALYTTVLESDGTKTVLTGYYNDVKIGSKEVPSTVSAFGENLVAYIGKSSYPDKFYQGGVKDVKIFDGVLSYKQVKTEFYTETLAAAKESLSLGDLDEVKADLTLPAALENNIAVSWETSDAKVVTKDGKVTRPEDGEDPAKATLTATLSLGGMTATKEFKITVVPWNITADLAEAKEALNMCTVTSENLVLPETGKYGSKITWKSSDTSVMKDDGTIAARPEAGKGNAKVKLTATITLEGKSVEKEFSIEVMEEFYAYVMSYIRGNNDRTGSLHLAYSTDGKNFTALNSNSGILFATIPTGNGIKNLSTGIRFTSPYIFRKADGTFGFTATQSNSQKYVFMYDSKDLVTFTGERKLDTNTAIGNPTSPQVVYDTTIGAYRVNWTYNGVQYSNVSQDLKTLEAAESYSYTMPSYKADTVPEGAIQGNVIGVTKAEYDQLLKKFTKATNTGIEELEDIEVKAGEKVELPSTVTAAYSDGSTTDMKVEWDTKDIDFSKAGTYEVEGTIQQIQYENPLIEERADPHIMYDEEEDCYYFTASYPAKNSIDNGYDRIILRKADTIEELADAEEITIWTDPAGQARHVWAPEIHKVNGTWYVFFAKGSKSSPWGIRPFVLVCQGDDPYDAKSWVKADGTAELHAATSEEAAYFKNMSLDMTYFEHNGKHYVIWADIIGQSALYMQEIDPDQPWVGKGKVVLLTTPEYGWERDTERVNEGATILKHDGKIFMAFSASGTGPEYCIGLMYADEDADLMDTASWTKLAYPVLTSSDVPGEYGPGHNSFTVDKDGNAVFVYHARSEECYKDQCEWANASSLYDPCRHARVKRVHWSADGMPILNMSYDQELDSKYSIVKITVTVNPVTDPDPGKKPVYEVFKDISEGEWFVDYVQYVFDKEIMTGIKDDIFAPADSLSRGQFATILYRMEGKPDVEYTNRFPDVPDKMFYTNPVLWASSKEVAVITGYVEGTFGPGDNITREQMAVMMYRYAKFKGYDTTASADLSSFSDYKDVSEFSEKALKWAVGVGVISGNEDGTLAPQGDASRAVCATIIQRFIEKCAK